MIRYSTIHRSILEGKKEIPYFSAHEVFPDFAHEYRHKFIFESVDVSPIYGRLSLIGIDPVLEIEGKGDSFVIRGLNERYHMYFELIGDDDLKICDSFKRNNNEIRGTIKREKETFEESKRSQQKNSAQIIRLLLSKFKTDGKPFIGLYGAFSYDFIRLFETIPAHLKDNDIPDFHLFLYDTFVHFDLLKEKCEIVVYRDTTQKIDDLVEGIKKKIAGGGQRAKGSGGVSAGKYKISDAGFSLSQKEYEKMVETARKYALEGELFEVVFANSLKAKFSGDPFALYLKYREANPSPYMFFFDLGEDQLVGASPEMMVRVENGKVHLRPISGTARRGRDPIEDHENMLILLNDPKERAELDMLIDLGRNDLSRICRPGIKISDYRFVEKYSRVMHTVAYLTGDLKEEDTALDALVACLNAGTLTGAPKVAAMTVIEQHEKERRGYYGGTIGYFTFSGDMDTGIIIRTAHIKNGRMNLKVGATLLYDSVPAKEYQETINKAQAFLDTLSQEIKCTGAGYYLAEIGDLARSGQHVRPRSNFGTCASIKSQYSAR